MNFFTKEIGVSIVLPGFLETTLNEAAAARGFSVESIVNAALSQCFQTTRDPMYQISTAAALGEVVTRVRAHRGYCPSGRPEVMRRQESHGEQETTSPLRRVGSHHHSIQLTDLGLVSGED
jgi:hypothetical protein